MSADVLRPGNVSVVIGAASGIGAALANAFGETAGRLLVADVEARFAAIRADVRTE